ncbi:glycerate kinase [Amycolatopsis thermophila]|uniref:Glycerate kinase n=1 Tax=Amycolatopsis thermophila TaxID=206084 RepID=A0ABU0EXQ1_9PSEU|nr:glycerate kinase [Amycolatopsis thermophila]MDQ0380100.1 glycerate kinase [Amycolatopsis thermophila]
MTRVVVAPDKFKGTLPAAQVAAAIAAGLRRGRPGAEVLECPIADGGDGTVAAAVAAGFEFVPARASGPVGEPVDTGYARRGPTAVIELAAVSGLAMLPSPAPLTATTLGVGELMRAALDAGATRLVLGLGGSSSTDGGTGLLRGLGARMLDSAGAELPLGGAALTRLARIDLDGLDARLRDVELLVASDVDNPLLGPHGAAAVYGPQKGATPSDVELLESALRRLAEVVRASGVDVAEVPGAGAAGGTGYALAVLGASFRPGIDVVLELTGLAEKLPGADLVITGEGSLDEQTLRGKGPAGIASAAAERGIPVVALAGRSTLDAGALRTAGFSGAYALNDIEPDVQRCLTEPAPLLERLAERVAHEYL